MRKIAVGDERANAQAALSGLLDDLERQVRDVDEPRGAGDALLHQVDQIGAAGNEPRRRIVSNLAHGIGDIAGAGIGEIDHATPPAFSLPPAAMTCSIAATILG